MLCRAVRDKVQDHVSGVLMAADSDVRKMICDETPNLLKVVSDKFAQRFPVASSISSGAPSVPGRSSLGGSGSHSSAPGKSSLRDSHSSAPGKSSSGGSHSSSSPGKGSRSSWGSFSSESSTGDPAVPLPVVPPAPVLAERSTPAAVFLYGVPGEQQSRSEQDHINRSVMFGELEHVLRTNIFGEQVLSWGLPDPDFPRKDAEQRRTFFGLKMEAAEDLELVDARELFEWLNKPAGYEPAPGRGTDMVEELRQMVRQYVQDSNADTAAYFQEFVGDMVAQLGLEMMIDVDALDATDVTAKVPFRLWAHDEGVAAGSVVNQDKLFLSFAQSIASGASSVFQGDFRVQERANNLAQSMSGKLYSAEHLLSLASDSVHGVDGADSVQAWYTDKDGQTADKVLALTWRAMKALLHDAWNGYFEKKPDWGGMKFAWDSAVLATAPEAGWKLLPRATDAATPDDKHTILPSPPDDKHTILSAAPRTILSGGRMGSLSASRGSHQDLAASRSSASTARSDGANAAGLPLPPGTAIENPFVLIPATARTPVESTRSFYGVVERLFDAQTETFEKQAPFALKTPGNGVWGEFGYHPAEHPSWFLLPPPGCIAQDLDLLSDVEQSGLHREVAKYTNYGTVRMHSGERFSFVATPKKYKGKATS